MIFTVVNYLPLIEEETVHTGNAFSKKQAADTEGSGEPDDEHKPGPENMFCTAVNLNWAAPSFSENSYIAAFHHYYYLSEGTFNPPPEV